MQTNETGRADAITALQVALALTVLFGALLILIEVF